MTNPLRELGTLRIQVEDVAYAPRLEAPVEKPHSFGCFISFFNDSETVVTIRGRKWVLSGEDGTVSVVEGLGVVGIQPEIAPGGHFSYHSYHVTECNAVVSGAFFGETAEGEWFFARIPEFELILPSRGYRGGR